MVVLLGDGIDSLFPGYDLKTIRLISFFILTPMLFLPIRHLSYTSLLGIISAFSIICVIVYDGLHKETAPGSLIEPAVSCRKKNRKVEWVCVTCSLGYRTISFQLHDNTP